jgi:PBS lyase HEAT-like repeat
MMPLRAAAIVLALLAIHAQVPAAWISDVEQARLVESLRAKLPAGWDVAPAGLGHAPTEWRTADSRTFEVVGRNGGRVFHTWFVPADWIGVREPNPARTRVVYWEGVLMDEKYKAITLSDETAVHEAVHAIGMNTPSLVNSGWRSGQLLFGARLEEIDRQTQGLVRQVCGNSRSCADEAALSLIVLGVPAKALTLECAEHATGQAQEYCASALGYWGGRDAVEALARLASGAATPLRARRSAAFSLGQIADPSTGPQLREALRLTPVGDDETGTGIAEAIGRIRYAAAGPDVLARFESATDSFDRARYAKVLGDLRYAPAVPALERRASVPVVTSEFLETKARNTPLSWLLELGLLRINGAWGQPAGGVRLLLVAPATASVPGSIRVSALIENTGDRDLKDALAIAGMWIVDGNNHPNLDPIIIDGNIQLSVNDVALRTVDLSKAISASGPHSVKYTFGAAASNTLTVQVR